MLKYFYKRKAPRQNPQLNKAAALFARSIIGIQTRIAGWLSKYEQHMTISQKRIALALFCVSMSILFGSFLYRNVINLDGASPSWLQQPSTVMPETYPLPDSVYLQKPGDNNNDSTFQKPGSINH